MTRRPFAMLATALALAACAVPSTPPPTRADALMQDLVARNRFQGAVVIGRGDTIDYAAGFGFADVERRVPSRPTRPPTAPRSPRPSPPPRC
jgi:CubicO group peptidase (beta-lactamase class C family)